MRKRDLGMPHANAAGGSPSYCSVLCSCAGDLIHAVFVGDRRQCYLSLIMLLRIKGEYACEVLCRALSHSKYFTTGRSPSFSLYHQGLLRLSTVDCLGQVIL